MIVIEFCVVMVRDLFFALHIARPITHFVDCNKKYF